MSQLVENMITEIVNSAQGLKATELVVKLVPCMASAGWDVESEEIMSKIDKMVSDKTLVIVRYVLPSMPYREKMFLLPKGTELK